MRRPDDDDVVSACTSLEWQERYCVRLGAPRSAAVLAALRSAADAGSLVGVPDSTRFGDLIGLRLLAAVHRIALEGREPLMAALHMTTGEDRTTEIPASAHDAAIVAAVNDETELVGDYLMRPPQTNEPGRARLLRAALGRIEGPVRLVELGASAGLNLAPDHVAGDPALDTGPIPRILERGGCDLNPIDLHDPSARRLLASYVWIDHGDRLAALDRAIEAVAPLEIGVERRTAANYLAAIEPRAGVDTVVWHSALLPYLTPAERQGVADGLDRLAGLAAPDRLVHHVSWEWEPGSSTHHQLLMRSWAGGEASELVLARGSAHGVQAA